MSKKLAILAFLCVQLIQVSAISKLELRYEIDAKRLGVSYTSEEALPRAREFKRLDSTYYVGWMYEGTFRQERAADYRGYKLAAEQLQKALDLLYKDFKNEITNRTSNFETFYKRYQLSQDYDYICYQLMTAYSNMEKPNLVWKHLQFCKSINHQLENYTDTYSYLAWTVHRNRFYPTSKYPFLKNSIAENEAYANKLLDTAQKKLKEDAILNDKMFAGDYYNDHISSVWHYRSILYSYQLDIENAAKMYAKLKNTYYFPENNFATFSAIQGKFREAAFYYNEAIAKDYGAKQLDESIYYKSILDVYRSKPKTAALQIKDVLSSNGTTPGFGWYNLALSRALIYDGQLSSAKKHTLTAEQFKEIHRGTTLGQSHYDFTTALLQLVIKQKEINQIKFMNKGWWYSLSNLLKLAQLTTEKYGLQFLIVNQLAANPERELVIYKLFSTENTVSYDEVWYLINDFSTNFFLKKYEEYEANDDRPLLRKYYGYFRAKMYIEKGEYKTAKKLLDEIINRSELDPDYEKLFLARVYMAYAQCLSDENATTMSNAYINKAYKTYPQLLPFEPQRISMRLHASPSTGTEKKLVAYLKEKNINWVNSSNSEELIDVTLKFGKQDGFSIISFDTRYKGEVVVSNHLFSYQDAQDAANELALYLFNIGNDEKSFNMNEVENNF